MERILYLVIASCAATGFLIAFNILHKKKSKKPLVCPLRFHCDTVVHSEYSKFLGIPLELIGMSYYLAIFVSYISFAIFPEIIVHRLFVTGVALATGFAFIFSIYLTAIQAFVLKQWCTWCLMSAGICTIIFLTVIQSSLYNMIPYLIAYKGIILVVHVAGVVLGLGAAIITDIFFMKFLKDSKITQEESVILKTFSQVIWTGLAIIITSGILMFLTDPSGYLSSSKFLAKMSIVAVIAVNGFLLNTLISPKLIIIPFGQIISGTDLKIINLRRMAFALGAISAVSWWSAFTLGMLRSVPFPYYIIMGIYLTILLFAVGTSQLAEEFIGRLKSSKKAGV